MFRLGSFIPSTQIKNEDLSFLAEVLPSRLRASSLAGTLLFCVSVFPDIYNGSTGVGYLLLAKLSGAIFMFATLFLAKDETSYKYNLRVGWVLIFVATLHTGAVAYLAGGAATPWILSAGLPILVAGVVPAYKTGDLAPMSAFTWLAFLIPLFITIEPPLYFDAATYLFYMVSFNFIGLVSGALQSALIVSNGRQRGRIIEQTTKAHIAQKIKAEFLSNVSHELKTPLTAVIGFSHLLAERIADEPEQEMMIDQIETSAGELMIIIKDLIELSESVETPVFDRREQHNICLLLEEVRTYAEQQIRQKNAKVSIVCIDKKSPTASFDRHQIRNAVGKLLDNALKFSDDNCQIEMGSHDDGNCVLIYIQDDGKGIKGDAKKHIFDQFWQEDGSSTRKHGGLGIGLAITRKFVEAHGGRMDIESGETCGSRFTIRLPKNDILL